MVTNRLQRLPDLEIPRIPIHGNHDRVVVTRLLVDIEHPPTPDRHEILALQKHDRDYQPIHETANALPYDASARPRRPSPIKPNPNNSNIAAATNTHSKPTPVNGSVPPAATAATEPPARVADKINSPCFPHAPPSPTAESENGCQILLAGD